ncbi:tryptophan 2,3-dioxygenase family protein [Amycolatopsis sp. NPDC059021]|uniref:tryptophan 2,3-dioxygenase family protein n=1 Tax=Amycolatopsis sp. NPDC059021 TaxID=3346704 RepID=UPI00366C7B28
MTELSYARYLNLDTLLSLQEPRVPADAEPGVVRSELFFVIVHQACELWLKQLVGDLEATADALSARYGRADAELAAELLDRAAESLRILFEQLVALEKLPVRHFAEFRPYLGRASGAESVQFARLSDLVGREGETGRLYQAFLDAADREKLPVAEICRLGPEAGVLHRVAEGLIDVGNRFWRWKSAHLGLMSKMLGGLPGTGGTSGAAHLAAGIHLPFPELRQQRSTLHRALAQPTA